MDIKDFNEWKTDRSNELKNKFMASQKELFSDYENREYELTDLQFAEEILNKFTLNEIEKAIFADVELERKDKHSVNGYLTALDVLRRTNGDKIKAISFLKKLNDAVIAYYDYKINVEKLRSKALSQLSNDSDNS